MLLRPVVAEVSQRERERACGRTEGREREKESGGHMANAGERRRERERERGSRGHVSNTGERRREREREREREEGDWWL